MFVSYLDHEEFGPSRHLPIEGERTIICGLVPDAPAGMPQYLVFLELLLPVPAFILLRRMASRSRADKK